MKQVADGVWRLTGGFPLRVNSYLVRDGDGVAVFDSGIRSMGSSIRDAAAELGAATRVVIGNAHGDHRGGASAIGAPVQCHAGERVGEFEVVHLPGHGPGCIGLWRDRDRVAITNDCFALFDPDLPRPGKPRVPHPAFNWSTDAARESIRKLAALEPSTCLPGHYGPLTGDVRAQLEAVE